MKKNVKKSMAMFLAAMMALGMMTGCGSSKPAETQAPAAETEAPAAETEAPAAETEAPAADVERGKIVVGSKGFTESFLLGEIYAVALEDMGYEVDRTFGLATCHDSMVSGDMDIYPEYTTTALTNYLGLSVPENADEIYTTVQEKYPTEFNLQVLDQSAVNDKCCIVMMRDKADELGITKLSDLQAKCSDMVLADFYGWSEREDNLPKMNTLYGEFAFKEIAGIDAGLKYDALKAGEVDVIPGNTTEPQLLDATFIMLEEDIPVWADYYVIPVVRQEVLDADPELAAVINKISAALDTDTMIGLIAEVDLEGEEYEDVALDFVKNLK